MFGVCAEVLSYCSNLIFLRICVHTLSIHFAQLICKNCYDENKFIMRDEDKICKECAEQLRERKRSIIPLEAPLVCLQSPEGPDCPNVATSTSIFRDSGVGSTNCEQPPTAPISIQSISKQSTYTERSSTEATAKLSTSIESARPESNRLVGPMMQPSLTESSDGTDYRPTSPVPETPADPNRPKSKTLRKTARVMQESFCNVLSDKISGKFFLVLCADYSLQFRLAKLVCAHSSAVHPIIKYP